MKFVKITSLALSVFIAALAIFSSVKLILVDRYPETSFFNTDTLKAKNIVNRNLTEADVAITIGSEAIQLKNPAFILVEDKDGKVIVISQMPLKESHKADEPHDVVGDKSLQNLLLQAVTASGNALAGWRCTGPYVNSNGEVVPRTCQYL